MELEHLIVKGKLFQSFGAATANTWSHLPMIPWPRASQMQLVGGSERSRSGKWANKLRYVWGGYMGWKSTVQGAPLCKMVTSPYYITILVVHKARLAVGLARPLQSWGEQDNFLHKLEQLTNHNTVGQYEEIGVFTAPYRACKTFHVITQIKTMNI